MAVRKRRRKRKFAPSTNPYAVQPVATPEPRVRSSRRGRRIRWDHEPEPTFVGRVRCPLCLSMADLDRFAFGHHTGEWVPCAPELVSVKARYARHPMTGERGFYWEPVDMVTAQGHWGELRDPWWLARVTVERMRRWLVHFGLLPGADE